MTAKIRILVAVLFVPVTSFLNFPKSLHFRQSYGIINVFERKAGGLLGSVSRPMDGSAGRRQSRLRGVVAYEA
jgi:hypothetical protein